MSAKPLRKALAPVVQALPEVPAHLADPTDGDRWPHTPHAFHDSWEEAFVQWLDTQGLDEDRQHELWFKLRVERAVWRLLCTCAVVRGKDCRCPKRQRKLPAKDFERMRANLAARRADPNIVPPALRGRDYRNDNAF